MIECIGYAPFSRWHTWYRITGNLEGRQPPLIVLHGGPGSTHNYLESLKGLASPDRAVIHYDQIGNGCSTHLRSEAPSFWTVELFLNELDNLLQHLGLSGSRYDLLGHSWGGMLAAEHAVRQPSTLRRLIIANSLAAMSIWIAEVSRLRLSLPERVQDILRQHELAGTMDNAAYQQAYAVFTHRHFCRLAIAPLGMAESDRAVAANPTVMTLMNGPNEFNITGTLRDWTIVDRLSQISVPTLLIEGRHDAATRLCTQPFKDRIPQVSWHMFEHSSHSPHVEETEGCLSLIECFLDDQEVAA